MILKIPGVGGQCSHCGWTSEIMSSKPCRVHLTHNHNPLLSWMKGFPLLCLTNSSKQRLSSYKSELTCLSGPIEAWACAWDCCLRRKLSVDGSADNTWSVLIKPTHQFPCPSWHQPKPFLKLCKDSKISEICRKSIKLLMHWKHFILTTKES